MLEKGPKNKKRKNPVFQRKRAIDNKYLKLLNFNDGRRKLDQSWHA